MSTKRVSAFLQLEELDLIGYYGKKLNRIKSAHDESENNNNESSDADVGSAEVSHPRSSIHDIARQSEISIHHGSFTWTNDCSNGSNSQATSNDGDSTPTVPWSLKDVNINIKPVRFLHMCVHAYTLICACN